MPNPSIAAIVTCHNYGHYLAVCLESLLRQTLPFTEVILVDDASEDLTGVIAARYRERGIRYERVEFRNVALSRQHGVNLSSSEFVVCIDADDWIAPEFNHALIQPLLDDPELALTYASWIFLLERENAAAYLKIKRQLYPFFEFVPRLLRVFNYIDNCAMVRRSAWLGQDPALSGHLEDWDHWLRIMRRGGKARLVRKRLLYYRLHDRAAGAENYIASKDASRKVIAERHRYQGFDLTVAVIFQEVLSVQDAFLGGLERMKVPEKTQFLLIDQTGDRAFHQRLLAFQPRTGRSQVIAFPHGALKVPAFFPALQKDAASAALRRAWNFSKHFMEGRTVMAFKAQDAPRPGHWSDLEALRNQGNDTLVCSDLPRVVFAGAFVMEKVSFLDGNLEKTALRHGWAFKRLSGPAPENSKVSVQRAQSAASARARRTSAIVTCHNYGRFLSKALDSLIYQTRPFDEIILVDDASNDNTREVWEKYYSGRVRYLRVDFRDQHRARDAGAAAASGEDLAFLDADDWVAPVFHERMSPELHASPLTGMVFAQFKRILEGEDARWYPQAGGEKELPWYEPFQFSFNRANSAFLIRREAWPFGQSFGASVPGGGVYGEDWELTLCLLNSGWSLRPLAEQLVFYRIHTANTTRSLGDLEHNSGLLHAGIRRAWLPYDLTVFVYLRSDLHYREKLLHELKTLAPGQKKQIIIIDGSGSGGLIPAFQSYAHFAFRFDRTFSSDGDWKWSALGNFHHYCLGRRILLWDPFYSVSPGAAETLQDTLSERSLPFIAARAVESSGPEGDKLRDPLMDPVFLMVDALKLDEIPARVKFDLLTAFESLRWWKWVQKRESPVLDQVTVRARAEGWTRPMTEEDLPAVSIVIPVKNDETRLTRLLESLRDLDYPREKFEILVVDNGSSDDTRLAASKFPEARVLLEPKAGSYSARNRGIQESRHRLIAFLDSDCTVNPAWLKELVSALSLDARIGAVAGDNEPADPANLWSRLERKCRGYCNFEGYGPRPPFGITMNILYRREVFEQCGMFDDSRLSGSDVEMTWRMQQSGSWRLLVLKGKAMVRHFDAQGVKALVRRHFRLGGGHFGHYERYFPFFEEHYRWLPLSALEIELQTAGRLPALFFRKKNPRETLLIGELFFSELRRMTQKLGYLSELRRREASVKEEDEAFVFFGDACCQPWEPFFALLAEKRPPRAGAVPKVLAVDPRAPVVKSWVCFLKGLLGGTNLWRWPLGVRSLELWELFPEKTKIRAFAAWNRRLNLLRIKKALRISPHARLNVGGWISRAEILSWQAGLGAETRLWHDSALELGRPVSPMTGCVLGAWDNDLDWEELRRLSELSLWPLVVLIRRKPEDRDLFFPKGYESAKLKVIFTEDLAKGLALIETALRLLVYVYKPGAAAGDAMPEELKPLLSRGIPVVTNRPDKTGGLVCGGHTVGREASLERQIYRLQLMPVWTHGTPVQESQTAGAGVLQKSE